MEPLESMLGEWIRDPSLRRRADVRQRARALCEEVPDVAVQPARLILRALDDDELLERMKQSEKMDWAPIDWSANPPEEVEQPRLVTHARPNRPNVTTQADVVQESGPWEISGTHDGMPYIITRDWLPHFMMNPGLFDAVMESVKEGKVPPSS